jgi:hypothetical protein
MCYFRQLLVSEKFGSIRIEGFALTDDAGNHPQDEQASCGPGDGAYPIVENETAHGPFVEAVAQSTVARRLQEGGGESGKDDEREPREGRDEGHARAGM